MYSEFKVCIYFLKRIWLTAPVWAFHLVFAGLSRFLRGGCYNIHLKRQPERGEEKKDEMYKARRGKKRDEMKRRWREKQEQRGYEGSCHIEHFLMSNKPHRRMVKRRPHSQAFELSKALPCTHGETYVPPPSPYPHPHKSYAYTLCVTAVYFQSISRNLIAGGNNVRTSCL